MVAARPTRTADLIRTRAHKWGGTLTCQDCKLELSDNLNLADMPECPGPKFRLVFVGGR